MLRPLRRLAEFVAELRSRSRHWKDDRDITVDEAVERFLVEHLAGEKGREESTVTHYRSVHGKWFSPEIGHRGCVTSTRRPSIGCSGGCVAPASARRG